MGLGYTDMDKTGKTASERHRVTDAVFSRPDVQAAVLADRQIHQTSADGQRAKAKAQRGTDFGCGVDV
jgi:hypothetical protein